MNAEKPELKKEGAESAADLVCNAASREFAAEFARRPDRKAAFKSLTGGASVIEHSGISSSQKYTETRWPDGSGSVGRDRVARWHKARRKGR